jgi:NAD(P)-dependent dehydrogenase (short-subunit alcohol dehydrogenase family)
MSLAGKVALITACGRGIGKEIALTLARNGCSVAVNSYTEDNTQALVDEIKQLDVGAVGVAGDITQEVVITQMVADTLDAFGQIDILVNNVGGVTMKQNAELDSPLARVAALWDGTYELSLKAPALMCEAVIPHFMERKSGKIINMSSIAGHSGLPHIEVTPIPFCYHSMKAGVTRYTQLLADQLGPYNINVNSICPGIVYTDAWKGTSETMVKNHPKFKGQDPREWFLGIGEGRYRGDGMPPTPMRREQTTTDIAEATLFLVSDAAANITGQSLTIDGGMVKN